MTARVVMFTRPEDDIVKQALEALESTRDPASNAVSESALIEEVSKRISIDEKKEKLRKAKRLVKTRERAGHTEAVGSYWLPGFEPIPYEPDQLVSDGLGLIVELDKATPEFAKASLERSEQNKDAIVAAHERKKIATEQFSEWATDELAKGRAVYEISFGNFIREKGYWSEDQVENHGVSNDDDDL